MASPDQPSPREGADHPTVCAVVVTFRRKQLLRKGLAGLMAQTRACDHILVVDNNSCDGTVELVAAEFPSAEILPLQENRGGAGGFSAGMERAHQLGYDWIWVMDDDIEVLPHALETLLSYRSVSKFIHGRREGPDGIVGLEALWDVSSVSCALGGDRSFEVSDQDWIPVRYANFEGPLIHRSVIDAIGLPDTRFFIAGDDMVYGLLASYHTVVAYVRTVIIRRQLSAPAYPSRLGWHLSIRNRFLIREHLRNCGVPITAPVFHLSTLLVFFWCIKTILQQPAPGKWKNITTVWFGLVHGFQGRYGRPYFVT
jgi:rhamnopyranosyl-N-acetylglucosaminyl-diphospho-decaprenol beta-1,3/1,4-galactofuranosyltransferase